MTFTQMLAAAWQRNNSLLCVGLDPDPAKFPAHLKGREDAILEFCTAIVDATADFVCAFKPQIAYFAAHRAEDQLEALIAHIHARHAGIPVILDAKRGDIGSTAEQYAVEAFGRFQADAVTVNPYMGRDSLDPWLAWPDKGVILLCRTSNPGGSDLQFLDVGGEKLYERVARLAAGEWNTTGQIALVVGATFPAEIARVRAIVGDMPLLVPHRRPGRRHCGYRRGGPHGQCDRLDDQLVPCHPLRRQGRRLCRRGPQGGRSNARRHQPPPLRKRHAPRRPT